MASPPTRGTGFTCILRLSSGTSMAPIIGAIRMTKGVAAKENAKATANDRIRRIVSLVDIDYTFLIIGIIPFL